MLDIFIFWVKKENYLKIQDNLNLQLKDESIPYMQTFHNLTINEYISKPFPFEHRARKRAYLVVVVEGGARQRSN